MASYYDDDELMMRALLSLGDLCLWWMCLLCAVKDEPLRLRPTVSKPP